jgi:frataxin-like iron-binding protein CyaY
MRSYFEFDLGGRLETKPYDRTSEQWLLYEPNGNVLTVRADKRYSYGPGDRQPSRESWLAVDA